ncbi:MAG: hypothetical protein H6711_35280 [Myxococcales bacterium]|nr:hypothetical protein [Myxococcales bacterium]MCB9707159.1 hypothetical protein [Myxococcales bacterium]
MRSGGDAGGSASAERGADGARARVPGTPAVDDVDARPLGPREAVAAAREVSADVRLRGPAATVDEGLEEEVAAEGLKNSRKHRFDPGRRGALAVAAARVVRDLDLRDRRRLDAELDRRAAVEVAVAAGDLLDRLEGRELMVLGQRARRPSTGPEVPDRDAEAVVLELRGDDLTEPGRELAEAKGVLDPAPVLVEPLDPEPPKIEVGVFGLGERDPDRPRGDSIVGADEEVRSRVRRARAR